MAKALNRLWRRRDSVFLERFHARLAEGTGSIRRVLVYVLNNARKHGAWLAPGVPDPFSSGPWFRYWRAQGKGLAPPDEPSPVVEHRDLGVEMAIVGFGIGVDDGPADRRRLPLGAW